MWSNPVGSHQHGLDGLLRVLSARVGVGSDQRTGGQVVHQVQKVASLCQEQVLQRVHLFPLHRVFNENENLEMEKKQSLIFRRRKPGLKSKKNVNLRLAFMPPSLNHAAIL